VVHQGGHAEVLRALIASAALGSVSAVARQSDLSVLVVPSSDRGVTPYTERLVPSGRHEPGLEATDRRQDPAAECLGRGRIDVPRLRESRPSLSSGALDGIEVHLGFSSDEEVDFWPAAADVVVVPCDRVSRSGVLNRAVTVGTPPAGVRTVGRRRREDRHRTSAPLGTGRSVWKDAICHAQGRGGMERCHQGRTRGTSS
jgi:hypothetical protein